MNTPETLKLMGTATLVAFLTYGSIPEPFTVLVWFAIVIAYVFGRLAGEGDLTAARKETAGYWQDEVKALKAEVDRWRNECDRLNP